MVTVSASTFQELFNEANFKEEHAEQIMDLAIDLINLYSNADLPNMTGTAGSKSVSLESKEKGAVLLVARAIYYGFYTKPQSTAISGQSLSPADVMGNQAVIDSVKEAARQLAELDVSYG
jgi:hypothetical protein